uniref:C2H2-type domain-containing protein n=1 Tax=Romanomermis culicivorax TaxID=13658 RepID=A0A915ISI7_ROMCU
MHICPKCQKLAPDFACLKVHLEYEDGFRRSGTAGPTSRHSNDNCRYPSKANQTKIFCFQCFKRYPIDNFDRHARDHLIKSQYLACNECFAVIKNDHDLKSHKSCLIAESLRLNDRLAIICRKCDFRSRDDAQFDRHFSWCHSTKKSMDAMTGETRRLETCLKDMPKAQALIASSETSLLSTDHRSASLSWKIDQPKIDSNPTSTRKPLLPNPLFVVDQSDRDVKASAIDLMPGGNFTILSDNKLVLNREKEISNHRDIDDQRHIKRKSSDNIFPVKIHVENRDQLNKKIKLEDSSTSSSDSDDEIGAFSRKSAKRTSSTNPAETVGKISELINNVGAQNASSPIRENLLRNKDNMAQNLLQNLKSKEGRNVQSQSKVVAKYHCSLCQLQPTVYLHSIKRHLTHVHKVCLGDEHKFYEKRDVPLTEKIDVATQATLVSLRHEVKCRTCVEKDIKIRKLSDLMKLLVTAASQVQ